MVYEWTSPKEYPDYEGRAGYYEVEVTWGTDEEGNVLSTPETETLELFLNDPTDEQEVQEAFDEYDDWIREPASLEVGFVIDSLTHEYYSDPSNFTDI